MYLEGRGRATIDNLAKFRQTHLADFEVEQAIASVHSRVGQACSIVRQSESHVATFAI